MIQAKNNGIAILGGSFDPPHKGHLKISFLSLKKLKIKKVLWLLTKKNPFKKKPYFSLKERVNACKKINIYFLMGSDNLLSFHTLVSWKKILNVCTLVVFSRKGFDKKAKKSVIIRYLKNNNIIFVKNKKINVSSTVLRLAYQKSKF